MTNDTKTGTGKNAHLPHFVQGSKDPLVAHIPEISDDQFRELGGNLPDDALPTREPKTNEILADTCRQAGKIAESIGKPKGGREY